MIGSNQLTSEQRDNVQNVLLSRHHHQHEKRSDARPTLPLIRSLADIGRRNSERRIEGKKLCVSN